MRPEQLRERSTVGVISTSDGGDAVAVAYEAFAPQLLRFATTRLRDAAAAEDVVQEAFVRLAVESQTFGKPVNERAWLYRVVTNLIISGARHAAVSNRRSILMQGSQASVDSPEVEFLFSERYQGLEDALEAAGVDGRTGLILAAQGYSGREIAHVLGRSVGATRTLLCRARGNVRREMDARGAGLGAV